MFIAIFLLFFIMRIGTLIFSIQNEKRLKKDGAIEYGKVNSTLMALLHFIFYVTAFIEALQKGFIIDTLFTAGAGMFLFSFAVLLVVIRSLKDVWTVKLLIAKKHIINKNFLFRYVRHPNYFLNIIPELIGIGLMCKAWFCMTYLFPVYVVILIIRIVQEENVMREKCVGF